MNFFVGYLVGVWYAIRRMKMWLLLYAITVVFGITAVLAIPDIVGAGLSDTLAAQKLMDSFNHTVFDDFIHEHGPKLGVVTGRLPLTGLLFVLLFLWLTGGILKTYDMIAEKFTFRRFWAGCLQYFWLLIKVFMVFLFIQALLAFLVYLPVIKTVRANFGSLENELSFYRMVKITVVIHLILAFFVSLVSDYTKVRLVKEGRSSVFKEIIPSFRFVFRHIHRTVPMYLLYVLTFVLISLCYWKLSEWIGMQTMSAILTVFVLQQLFIFFRVGTKLMNLGSICAMHEAILLRERKREEPMEIEL